KSEEYYQYAEKVKEGILENLYNPEKGIFYKYVNFEDGNINVNETLDSSSLYGIFKFKVLESHDEKVLRMQKALEQNLRCKVGSGGYPRYQNDYYFRANNEVEGNPWIITT